VWVGRYCEDVIGPDGAIASIRRSEVLGTVAEIPTRRQAEQLLADRLRPINSGHYRLSSLRTLGDYAETIWLPEVLPTLKYSTKRYYQYMLRVHLYPTFADVQLRLITRDAVQKWIRQAGLKSEDFLFPSRIRSSPHVGTREYARIIESWVEELGLDPADYGTHSMRRTKATLIYRRTGNLRAVQLLLGHTKIESTVRYLGIEVDDALAIAEQVDV